MFFSRRVFLSSKLGPTLAVNLLRRSGPSKRTQRFSFTQSSRHSHGIPRRNNSLPVETQASRSWAVYAVPAVVLGFAGFASFLHYNDERRSVPKGQGGSPISNTTVKGPIIGRPFTLISTENKMVTEKDFLGNWVLLYFGYTFSPDVGPEQLTMMAKAIDKLECSHNLKILPVFVTMDPQRDTPSHLHAYLKEIDGRIMGLTGPVGAIRQMAQEYRVYFKKVEEEGGDYLVDTSHNMYLLNPKMEVVRCFGVEYTADELSREILKEVSPLSRLPF
ncbi:PREDICTED: protein SCO1 homolog 2, mitochondrial-like [Tarenaya hassleriana]|uniref:protein SCO1 homolog 2, mitochondrial-like n=1 Tax=Tarenaya hassleriana TaxID=28532 RepID=UPI00053C936A|nr:PREDICTED: protein SCO1 homolog 2, mitochondrial-like [Tarenaya hassleriana]